MLWQFANFEIRDLIFVPKFMIKISLFHHNNTISTSKPITNLNIVFILYNPQKMVAFEHVWHQNASFIEEILQKMCCWSSTFTKFCQFWCTCTCAKMKMLENMAATGWWKTLSLRWKRWLPHLPFIKYIPFLYVSQFCSPYYGNVYLSCVHSIFSVQIDLVIFGTCFVTFLFFLLIHLLWKQAHFLNIKCCKFYSTIVWGVLFFGYGIIMWPWPSCGGHSGLWKVVIEIIWDISMGSVPVKLRSNGMICKHM